MPRIDVKSITANNIQYFNNGVKYIAKKDKCDGKHIGATNLYLPEKRKDLERTVKLQMEDIRNHYNKENKRLGIHAVFAFSQEEDQYLTEKQALEIAYRIAEREFQYCPTYFSVHNHTETKHIDMLILPINLQTGNMYGCNRRGWNAIESRLIQDLENFVPKACIGGHQVAY